MLHMSILNNNTWSQKIILYNQAALEFIKFSIQKITACQEVQKYA